MSKTGKGVGILIGSIFLYWMGIVTVLFAGIGIVLLIVYFIVFIWQIIDARKLCVEFNMYLSTYGKPPW